MRRPVREQIIKALHHCTGFERAWCRGCPYNTGTSDCLVFLLKDILILMEGEDEDTQSGHLPV